ncbi:MAG: EAL domain-containing protein [Alkalimonas sp.]|nr:EAL domain-containing protein [Alkalimonas sp.]
MLLLFFLQQRWQLVMQEHSQHQHTQVQQLSSSVQSLLSVQQVLADLYHDEFVQLVKAESLDMARGTSLLDHLMHNNRFATAYAVSKLDGEILLVSSNRTIAQLGNLRQYAQDHGEFEQALDTDRLVLGRTYYIEPLNSWTIPVRMALRAPDGQPIAMMALGVSLKAELADFVTPLLLPNDNSLALIRQQDGFYQFYAGSESNQAAYYDTPVAVAVLRELQQQLKASTGKSLQQLRQTESSHHVALATPEGRMQAVLRYLPEYQLWAVSTLHNQLLQQAFWRDIWRYLAVFVISQLMLFLLVRTIAQAERSRRAELLFEATHDQLTGLPNRNYIRQYRTRLLGSETKGCYLLFLDLDNFKTINDSFGHELGDSVLREVARRIKEQANRASSIVRHGGDEFLIFQQGCSEQEAGQLANRLIEKLSSPYLVNKLHFVLGASIGVAHYPSHVQQLDELIRAADVAMYEAKKTKNNVFFYTKQLDKQYQRRFSIEQRLRAAIEHQHLFMVYQPQIDASGQLYGVEALVRWHDPIDGFIPPDQFIPVAEKSGQMPLLGQFIMQQACSEIRQLQQQLRQSFQLSLNISVLQLLQADFVAQLTRQIHQSGLATHQLTIELTESILIEDHEHICQLLHSIKQLGCKISMDDFGTGYSSLSMLRTLPVDELKIDKSFVDCIQDDETCRNMTASMIAIGQRMQLITIAEGVEHDYERDLLLQMGCQHFQGYLFAKPMQAQQLLNYLQTQEHEQQPHRNKT